MVEAYKKQTMIIHAMGLGVSFIRKNSIIARPGGNDIMGALHANGLVADTIDNDEKPLKRRMPCHNKARTAT